MLVTDGARGSTEMRLVRVALGDLRRTRPVDELFERRVIRASAIVLGFLPLCALVREGRVRARVPIATSRSSFAGTHHELNAGEQLGFPTM